MTICRPLDSNSETGIASIAIRLGVCIGACSTQTELPPRPTVRANVTAPFPPQLLAPSLFHHRQF
jgi:hypothetical protein